MEGLERLESDVLSERPDIVLVEFGANDWWRDERPPEDWAGDLGTVLARVKAQGAQAVECTAYDNMSNGFDMASACILRDCLSSANQGHGVRTFANSWVTDNHFHGNTLDGIRISSTDCHVEGNQVTQNGQTGLAVTSSGNFIVRNMARGNLTNFNLVNNNAHGPILDVGGIGDLTNDAAASHPWANFAF